MPETTSRILYVDPLTEAPALAFPRAAALGFTHAMVPPPWPPSARGDRFAPSALTLPCFGTLTKTALDAGIGLLVDLQINRLAAGAGATIGRGLFHAVDPLAVLDPRHGVDLDADTAFISEHTQATALGAFWAGHLVRWGDLGAAGFRLLGLDGLPPASIGAFLAALRAGARGGGCMSGRRACHERR